jgi:uncharacterized protein (TIGR00369 family)
VLKDTGICFACGKSNPHGLQLKIRKNGKDGVELDYAVPEQFAGWQGIAHGGIVATILDELMAWACTEAGFHSVTGEMTVRFRRPLQTGVAIHGVGRITGMKGRLLLTESRLFNAAGELVAEATGKMMHVSARVEE